MAVTYGFFNSVNGDRKYNAEQMSEYFRGIINEGVYQHLDGGLAVTAGTGLAVNVAAGRAIIQNRWIQNSAAMSLTIAAASETYARKDAVVIRLNWSSRSISIAVKTGTPAASPVAPSMTRNSTTYEMALAYVNVAANATSVTVTDKRSDSTVCGWVTVAQSTSGEVDAMLNDMKTGFDGVVYPTPAAMVQGSDAWLSSTQNAIGEKLSEYNQMGLESDKTPVLAILERGAYDSSGNKSQDTSDKLCRTINKIKTSDVDQIILDRSTKSIAIYVNYWDENGVHKGRTSYQANVTINKAYDTFTVTILDYTGSSFNNPFSVADGYKYVTMYRANENKNTGEVDAILPYTEVLSTYGYKCSPVTFEQGRINFSTGADYDETDTSRPYRIRSVGYNSTEDDCIVNLQKKTYFVYLYYYNANKVFQYATTSAQTSRKVEISKTYPFFRICILNYDDSSYLNPITPEECYQNIFVCSNSQLSNIIETGERNEIPSYFDTQLATVKSAIMTHNGLVGKNGESFVFLTDIHWANNQHHAPALIKYIINNNLVNRVVMGGDYLTDHSTREAAMLSLDSCMKEFFNLSDYVFPIFGNHDINSNWAGIDPDKNLTDAETYSLINQWMNNDVSYGGNYFDFYWDDEKSNTRFVMIDTGAQTYDPSGRISEDTFTWLETVLNTDKNIIVFAHWLFSASQWDHPLVDGVLTGSFTQSAQRLFGILDDLNADGGKVQAIITGHVHCDYNDETTGGIPIIWTDTDCMQALGEYPATAGTVSEQCIDVISIDYTNKKIYCDRIGRGVSREISY